MASLIAPQILYTKHKQGKYQEIPFVVTYLNGSGDTKIVTANQFWFRI